MHIFFASTHYLSCYISCIENSIRLIGQEKQMSCEGHQVSGFLCLWILDIFNCCFYNKTYIQKTPPANHKGSLKEVFVVQV